MPWSSQASTRPDHCFAWDPADLQNTLGLRDEQRVAKTYITAFFARHLQGDTSFDDVLSGANLPMADTTVVEVRDYAGD